MRKMLIAWLTVCAVLYTFLLPVSASDADTAGGDEGEVILKKSDRLIYEETFDYEDEKNQTAVLEALGWLVQNKANGAYSDATAKLALSGGRLLVANDGGRDSYFLMLNEEQMGAYAEETITIQYEVEYTTASDNQRYFALLANYNGSHYNSFHLRNNGSANNQAHCAGKWSTYDIYDSATDANASARDNGDGTSIAMKLLGKKFNSGVAALSGVPVTIRYTLSPTEGTSVYAKLASDAEDAFVLVSVSDPRADGAAVYGTWDANAICLKIGGAQNGYLDNIAVWTGGGDYPQPEIIPVEKEPVPGEEQPSGEKPSEEKPETENKEVPVKEPQTIANKVAIWAVALFGGWIIWKKEKGQ